MFFAPDITKVQNYKFVRELGNGDYGQVTMVQNKVSREQLALKVLEIPKKEEKWLPLKAMLDLMIAHKDYRSILTIKKYKAENMKAGRGHSRHQTTRKLWLLTELCQCNLIEDIRKRYSMSKVQRRYYTEE